MNPFASVWSSLRRLADALGSLADTVEVINETVRERTRLEPPPAPLLPAKRELPGPAPVDPEDIDHTANGYLPPTEPPTPTPEPPKRRGGRAKAEQTAQP